jgi:hypothetical protein
MNKLLLTAVAVYAASADVDPRALSPVHQATVVAEGEEGAFGDAKPVGLLGPPPVGSTFAKRKYDTANFLTCVEVFYDPRQYHWLAFRNHCNEVVSITYVFRSSAKGSSQAVVGSGKVSSTGFGKAELKQRGGLDFAVCRNGFTPYDQYDHYWETAGWPFRCLK